LASPNRRKFDQSGHPGPRSSICKHTSNTGNPTPSSFFPVMYVCMYVCLFVHMFVCLFVCVCMYLCKYVCLSLCLFVFMFVCLFLCMYVCMFLCIFVCLYVCMFLFHFESIFQAIVGLREEECGKVWIRQGNHFEKNKHFGKDSIGTYVPTYSR
jgi:hypothetical protein